MKGMTLLLIGIFLSAGAAFAEGEFCTVQRYIKNYTSLYACRQYDQAKFDERAATDARELETELGDGYRCTFEPITLITCRQHFKRFVQSQTFEICCDK